MNIKLYYHPDPSMGTQLTNIRIVEESRKGKTQNA